MNYLSISEGGKLNVLYWVSTGFSGLSMVLLNMLFNSILPDKELTCKKFKFYNTNP